MSSKRASAMAQINNYTAEDIKNAATPDDAVAMFLGKPIPSMAPGTQPSVKEDIIKAKVGDTEVEDKEKVEGPSALDLGVGSAYDFIRAFYRSSKTRLEGLPIPGGIGLPVGILFALFLLLLPVNGHTRIMWLWLAITGQAQIGGPLTPITALTAPTTGGASGGGTFSYNTGTPSVNPNQTGTSANAPSTATPNHSVVVNSKHSSTVVTNKSHTHGGTTAKHKGGGPGPYDTSLPDPTAPIAQISYSHLLRSYNGYE